MSEKQPSEYLKRTCLICGCHTNQTINIYEPRSGPNIVKLIQAKFKFQPLNEDKYLCFSCNNWLINWHSLQALNSNDAESPSGTFRSNVNPVVHEKAARKVAIVRPLVKECLAKTSDDAKSSFPIKAVEHALLSCGMCGRAIVLKANTTLSLCLKCREVRKLRAINHHYHQSQQKHLMKRPRHVVVRPQRSLVKTMKKSNEKLVTKVNKQQEPLQPMEVVVLEDEEEEAEEEEATTDKPQKCQSQSQPNDRRQFLKRPLVDGKVVSMLRRLNTTLSRENHSQPGLPPVIMAIQCEQRQAPRWPRPLEDDEVLLDFNTAISEVLPSFGTMEAHRQNDENDQENVVVSQINYKPVVTRSYHNSNSSNNKHHHHHHNQSYQMSATHAELPKDICSMLPKGLSIAVVSH